MGILEQIGSRGDDRGRTGGGRASAVMLVGANLVPLAGVLFWGWGVLNVVALYWLENVLIGGINVLKMLTCSPDAKQIDLGGALRRRIAAKRGALDERELEQLGKAELMVDAFGDRIGWLNHASKLFLVPFFIVHYGFFCFGHGIFVFALLGDRGAAGAFMPGGPGIPGMGSSFLDLVRAALAAGGIWAVLVLGVSHFHSFIVNYLGKGEFRRTAAAALMIAPYGRVVVLHLAILFGGFVVEALGSPTFLLVLLVLGKIALDWTFHQRTHRRLAAGSAG